MQTARLSNIRRLAAAAALATLGAATAVAEASPPNTMSGWGQRGGARFMGSITRQADGSLHGHFTIVVDNGGKQPTVCRYGSFQPLNIDGGSWQFTANGTCWGQFGPFTAANRVSLNDGGAGLDTVDVNYVGSTGVAIPGGALDDGDIVYTP